MTYEEDLAARADDDGGVSWKDQVDAAAAELERIKALPGIEPEVAARINAVALELSELWEWL